MSNEENVRVVVRVRPLNKKEIKKKSQNIVAIDKSNRCVSIQKPSTPTQNYVPKTFTFDYVFGENSSQSDIYVETAKFIIDGTIDGYNGTIFAYGQTGTGKTYTMIGATTPETYGIVPNCFAHLFGHIAKASDCKFLLVASYLEIYNEEIRDLLLRDQVNLEIREKPSTGVFVEGLSAYVCRTAEDIYRVLKLGNDNRAVGATAMNDQSSRSHAILTINVERSTIIDDNQKLTCGKLCLVDLAGSERQSKAETSGSQLKESAKINLSLSVLGIVISALVDGKSSHVPYRNSKLTRLLQDSLGGNSKTVMVATISPADINYEETISTLRYANRAKNIRNTVKINEDPQDALLKRFEQEILQLRQQLEQKVVREIIVEEEEDDTEVHDNEKGVDIQYLENEEEAVPKLSESLSQMFFSPEENDEEESNDKDTKKDENEELSKTISEQNELRRKLKELERGIIFGGENLLEKAVIQQKLLEEAEKELEERRKQEEIMLKTLKDMEVVRVDMEEKYNSLAEEAAGKTQKINKLVSLIIAAKAELADIQKEQQREMEASNEITRMITRELSLCNQILAEFVPKEYVDMIERLSYYNEEIGEWQLKCVAYTGNNMNKTMKAEHDLKPSPVPPKFNSYWEYHTPESYDDCESDEEHFNRLNEQLFKDIIKSKMAVKRSIHQPFLFTALKDQPSTSKKL